MDPREQLLQSLMQDLQNAQAPELWDKAKQDQVMKGRRGQADIDAGRAAIAENARLVAEAKTQRGQLQERIRTLQSEIDTAKTKAAQDDPLNQAVQYGESIGVPAAGYATGHALGRALGAGLDTKAAGRADDVKALADKLRNINRTSPTSKAETAAILDTYDKGGLKRTGRSPSQFLGPAALFGLGGLTTVGADYADDPHLKKGLQLAGTAERAGAGGMLLQQLYDTLRAKSPTNAGDVADIEAARRVLNEGGRFGDVQGAIDAPAADPATPARAAPKPGTRPALYAEAKARGLPVTTRTSKADIEKLLARAMKANAKRSVADKTSKAIVPLAVGASVYDALRTPAEAADGSIAEPMGAGEAAAIGTGAGAATGYGMDRLRQALKRVPGIGAAMGQANIAMLPAGIDAMTDYSPDERAGARNFAARNLPSWMQAGAIGEAADMSQVPERNPLRTEASPGNQYYPLSAGQMPQQPGPEQVQNGDSVEPVEAPAEPSFASLDALAAAADEDPELAAMIRDLVEQRLAGTQLQAQ